MSDSPRNGPSFVRRPAAVFGRPAFTLLEMLTTVAALVIVLGLMVSLARDVRSRSADRLTKDLLGRLDRLMAQYARSHNDLLPAVAPLAEHGAVDESSLHRRALLNNRQFVHALLHQPGLERKDIDDLPVTTAQRTSRTGQGGRPDSWEGERRASDASGDGAVARPEFEMTIHDAWGGPVVFMPGHHPAIGMAPGDRFFFMSAGPDGRFLTREDNLYSYETVTRAALPTPDSPAATTRPAPRPAVR